MATSLTIVLSILVIGAMVIWPKLGSVLVWLVVFFYPHLYMQQLGLLPWNIGFDDLFICLFFLTVLIRRTLIGGTPVRMGLSMLGTIALFVIWTVATLSGWSIMPDLAPVEVIKPILKWVILVLLVYGLLHTIDNERDIRRAAYVYIGIMTAAAISVILQRWFPAQMVIFATERQLTHVERGDEVQRAVGVMLNANGAACLLGMSAAFTLTIMGRWGRGAGKVIFALCLIVMLIGITLTRSRAGAMALGTTFLMMGVFSRHRMYVALAGIGALGVMTVRPEWFLEYWYRIADIYNADAGGQLGENVQQRLVLWRKFMAEASAQAWLFGQGRTVGAVKFGLTAHSSYISAMLQLGFGGLVWFFVYFGMVAHRAFRLTKMRIEPYSTLAAAVLWTLLLWAVAGVTIDMLLGVKASYIYSMFAVLIDRSYAMTVRNPAWQQATASSRGLPGNIRMGPAPSAAGQGAGLGR